MKKSTTKIALVLFTIAIILFIGCKKTDLLSNYDQDYEYLPQDVKQSCVVTEAEFKTWFKGGNVTENGLVEPANSVTFPHNNNCDFYKWSEQMFLWITSPTSSGVYKSGGTVMESPVFYTVSAQDKKGNRILSAHTPNTIMSAASNIVQTGPNRLPIVFDKNGGMFEVEPQVKNEAVKDATNKSVVVGSIVTDANGLHSFMDIKGKIISSPKAVIDSKVHPENIIQEFKRGNKTIFLDSKGRIVDTEQGQAGSSGALVAVNKSLVYYITMVNDVYAYFLTGVKDKKLNGNEFPTTAGARDSILAYAKAKGFAPPPDPDALAMELKTSWVEVKDLPNADSYIKIKAKVPVYDKSNPKLWVLTGKTREATLALVGMHVVGSVAGHPEMIWATFEHKKNAPNAGYAYRDVNDKIKQIKGDTGNGWLFNANPNDTIGTQNIQNMTVVNDTLNTDVIKIINPAANSSTVRRIMAWGVASNVEPNPEDKTPADSNSEVISINNAISKMLVGNDIRKNYLLIGATWTSGGVAPNGFSYPYNGTPVTAGNAIGTGRLANTTMETFFQSPSSNTVPTNTNHKEVSSCLYCHGYSLNPMNSTGISHIFSDIIPLPPYAKKLLPK